MNCCVVGLAWGDEGKGKVVDILAEKSDMVVRYGGGANAGHTVVIGEKKFALHIMPSGAVREGVKCVISNGVVVDPEILAGEIDGLNEKGIDIMPRLFVSRNAHMVMDYHKLEDRLREAALGKAKIGTTARGIGPCYADKTGRSFALRCADLLDLSGLREKLTRIAEYKNRVFAAVYDNPEKIDADAIFEKCRGFADKLAGCVCDTTQVVHEAIDADGNVLFEGAQGALLDLDHGTFPYVTSSNASALGMPAGCGVPAKLVDKFIGVIKAYSTRVGAGPFPTEQENEIGQTIRDKGNEYGTTTGRPRRCGWLDGVTARYSAKIGGIDEIAMMHLDTLAGMREVKVCRAYNIDGREVSFFPSDPAMLERAECVYETVPGWDENLRDVKKYDELPDKAKRYVELVEKIIEKPVTMVGVGPGRSQALTRG